MTSRIVGTNAAPYEIDNRPKSNTLLIMKDLAMEALGTNVLIKEDKFKTGYECQKCDGSGLSAETCTFCKGTGYEANDDKCRLCDGHKLLKCSACKGRGGLIVAPEESQRRPSSGVVMSIGPDVKRLKEGDRVFYSNFAGTAIAFKQLGVARIMHEDEIQGRLYGVASLGDTIR